MKDEPLIEIVDRLARIETKLDNHEQLREKADIALSMAKNNEGDIAEIKRIKSGRGEQLQELGFLLLFT
ncbi:putative holin [Enterococcus faecalis ATCC 29212]|nr:putative holin [Enterococcus faecalis ATCC 29212]